ncbi:MAG: hypothetical protein EB078_08675 [Proteobacteria bacterium]|nr:hypothetical protein [Pseudomonadota bacterium]NDC24224.1 hypothetical protein [Pseudomonadota bacterium]NDD04967.1 hypothetical protein [Pseudomonadota bacterium]NDG26179.1 hypothetical protein [Pseudomonadota bacterium]
MVKAIFLGLFWTFSIGLASDSPRFRLQFSKQTIFSGEQVIANFVLESVEQQLIEVEVVKFPEFRGFWSENLILRQGRIPVLPMNSPQSHSIGVVGSYSLFPIVNMRSPSIQPMSILAKDSNVGLAQPLNSEADVLKILPLPPLPKDFSASDFSGAVGKFQLSLEKPEIPFRKSQPFSLKLRLTGEGNFPEINNIPLRLPKDLSILSQTAMMEGTVASGSKIFEWTLSTDNEALTELDLGTFLFFDPLLKKYVAQGIPKSRFRIIPDLELPPTASLMTQVSIPQELSWSPYSPGYKNVWLLVVQGFMALMLITKIVITQRRRLLDFRSHDPLFQRGEKKKKAIKALRNHDWSTFLPLAADLCRQSSLRKPHSYTDSAAVSEAIKVLIDSDHQLRFSPQKSLRVSHETLNKCWACVEPYV